MRGRPEAVLVERVPGHRQRIVDPDRLARDLAPILVDREIGREVRRLAGVEPGRLEVEVLHEQQPGRADRLDGERLALGDHEPLLVTQSGGDGGRDQEQDQPGMGQERRHLRVLVTIAVEIAGPVVGTRLADLEAIPAQHPADAFGRHIRHRRAIGETRIEEGLGLGDPDLGDAAPQPGRPVERADDDGDDQDRQPGAEPH